MTDKPIIFNFHAYPWLIHRLTYRRTNHHNLHVRGYKEKGNINTPMELAIQNQVDRFMLAIDANRPHPVVAGARRAARGVAERAARLSKLRLRVRHRQTRNRGLEMAALASPAGSINALLVTREKRGTGTAALARRPQRAISHSTLNPLTVCVHDWFQGRYLAQPTQMSVCLTELGGQKGLDQVPSHRWSDCPATHANNVHVIILDPLPRREVIVDQRRAHAGNLVGTYRCPHTAAADRHATFDLTHRHSPGERGDKIRIVVVRLSIFAPKSMTS